ncbi:MAG: carnitine dehydratase [Pyrinomonas sp.]|uniref:CaiB/BaiF CoA transferase family protein n=1 Tax=Pyrinomonas sp. TaxID=2080306 RepID=UPI00332B373E
MSEQRVQRRPLAGLRVLEMGQLLAGPFAAAMLAGFGAEVIKIERPRTGDPIRRWRKIYRGTSLWWLSLGRNKKSITLDLTRPEGQQVARRLAAKVDLLLENFKPGTLERWGMSYEELRELNPRLIMVRVSGWGQTGPYASRPGYANVAEAMGGIRYTTGYPDRPPVRTGVSLGDTLAGLHAALGALVAIYHRDVHATGQGQVVDVAIYEAVFNMMESMLAEYDKLGFVRERTGPKLEGIVPTSTYRCADGKYIVIGGNGDSIFKRLMHAIERPDLAEDPRLAHNDGRVTHEEMIDRAIEEWTSRHPYEVVFRRLTDAEVPCGPIYSIADIVRDEHYIARGMFEEVDLGDGDKVKIPSVVPKLTATPGGTDWPGPPLGAHNHEIYRGLLGMSEEELQQLQEAGVI